MTLLQGVALFFAAIVAGAINSVAGGGSFVSFPTLLFAGVPAIPANATNATAMFPGSLASIPPYREDLGHERREVILFSVISAAGGIVGAIVLAKTPSTTFQKLIPFLILSATLIFASGGQFAALLKRLGNLFTRRPLVGARANIAQEDQPSPSAEAAARARPKTVTFAIVLIIQFVIAMYGGFFGAGVGIMMLAGFALLGMANIHAMNALKVVLSSVINGVAVVTFAILHIIFWPQAILMAVGAIIGGYGGATLAHAVPAWTIRWFVIAVGCALSIVFFVKYLT